MSERPTFEVRGKTQFRRVLMAIIFTILPVVSISATFLYVSKSARFAEYKQQQNDVVLDLEKSLKECSLLTNTVMSDNTRLMNNNKQLKSKLDVINERMKGIKDKDDLMRRDMFLYIDHRYRSVPKTIATGIAETISYVCKNENVPPELVMGIIEIESRFNPMAISKAGARGLMQVMPEWAKKFKLKHVTDLHDIEANINIGIKVLKIHIDERKGNVTKGLYYYSGKSKTYADKVYSAMGKFVAFRATVNDDEESEEKEVKTSGAIKQ
jgi:hypothetical protein